MEISAVPNSWITSCLDFCKSVYIRLYLETSPKLELIHNPVGHGMGTSQATHIIFLFWELYTICFQVQFGLLVVSFKIFHCSGPRKTSGMPSSRVLNLFFEIWKRRLQVLSFMECHSKMMCNLVVLLDLYLLLQSINIPLIDIKFSLNKIWLCSHFFTYTYSLFPYLPF